MAGVAEAQQRRISKNAFGNDWPLVADSATLARSQDQVVIHATAHLSDQELDQIDVEGHERLWPPLPTPRHTVDALVDAGKWLCR